jgi:hypothetical protein
MRRQRSDSLETTRDNALPHARVVICVLLYLPRRNIPFALRHVHRS